VIKLPTYKTCKCWNTKRTCRTLTAAGEGSVIQSDVCNPALIYPWRTPTTTGNQPENYMTLIARDSLGFIYNKVCDVYAYCIHAFNRFPQTAYHRRFSVPSVPRHGVSNKHCEALALTDPCARGTACPDLRMQLMWAGPSHLSGDRNLSHDVKVPFTRAAGNDSCWYVYGEWSITWIPIGISKRNDYRSSHEINTGNTQRNSYWNDRITAVKYIQSTPSLAESSLLRARVC
jgi:hypothetical protein